MTHPVAHARPARHPEEGRTRLVLVSCVAALLALPLVAESADLVTLAHSDWAIYRAGIVALTSSPTQHGDPSLYQVAPPVPRVDDGVWKTLTAPAGQPRNPSDIDYLGPNDDYSSGLTTCLTQVDFTYFQTLVTVPANFAFSTAQISLGPLDDGARVMVFNSAHPTGAVPSDGVLVLGDARTIDLGSLLKPGEANRVVVQHVDDCAAQGWLGPVELVVTGATQAASASPSWGELKSRYH